MYIDPVNYLENFIHSLSDNNNNNNDKLELNKLLQALKCRLEDYQRIYQTNHHPYSNLSHLWLLITDLNLSNIQLKLIPNENIFGYLLNLKRLWLHNNQLMNLNNCLIKCNKLIELRLNSNQLHNIFNNNNNNHHILFDITHNRMYIDPVNYLENFIHSLSDNNNNNNDKLELNKLLQALKCRLEDYQRIYQTNHHPYSNLSHLWLLITDLNLSNIQLKLIPNENIFGYLLNLKRLWLHNNQLMNLNNCLIKCNKLIELRLNSNQLHNIYNIFNISWCEEINKELSRMHFLRELNLLGNPAVLQSDFKSLLLSSHSTLTVLNKHAILRDQFMWSKLKTNYCPKYIQKQSSKRKRNVPIQAETEEKVVQSPMNPDKEIEIFEENLKKRFQAKTITEFKCFDWSMIPNSEMKRLNSRTTGPKNIVVQSQL
ncbi:uncharacterized protein DC041_0002134 [Schistosoma bovis]|uniref:Uncharacterized protein n=1 Tax=Schistosoma bovis TaxID=6184 RepID=A0A430Q6M0_SCHBO|nr:uncharacterized protein DC041_0002134 [Schistosoma bovis]